MSRLFRVVEVFFSSALIAPLFLIVVYIAILFILKGSALTPSAVVEHFASLYERYGYEIIFMGAFLESLVVINFFVPGATIVVLGAVFASSGYVDLTYAVISAATGSILGFTIDYLLGYFGFSGIINRFGYGATLKKAKKQLDDSSVRTFALGFIHPNIGSFISAAAGTIGMKFVNFFILALFSTLTWSSIWGLVIFAFGDIFLKILTRYTPLLVILILSIWVLLALYQKNQGEK